MPRKRFQHLLIRTKMNRPLIGEKWVQRPRLIPRLEEALKKRVTLISAPAGFGKTTLAVQWLDQSKRLSAWFALDKNDSDPERFLRYVIAALRTVVPRFGSILEPLLSSVQLPPPDYLADAMVSELAALKEPVILVLDDYQAISSDAVHKILTRMVEHLPDNLHLVILTRLDPPGPLAKWRANQWLNELRASDLSFTQEETQTFFKDYALTVEAIGILQKKIEGWIAGLQLARLSLTDADNPEQFVRRFSGSDRLIVDYLMDEVISHQSAEVLDFLASTAILERFCAPLVDFMLADGSGRPGSRQIIALLEKENLFLVPLDNERNWYRYHHLFQNLLTHNFGNRWSPERKALLYRRAAEWFAGQELIEEALHYFLAAGDVDQAAALIELNLEEMFHHDFSRRTQRRWLDMFPASALKLHPALAVALVYCKIQHWDRNEVDQLLDAAEARLKDSDCTIPESRRQELLAHVDAQRGFYLFWNRDPEGALKHTLRVLKSPPGNYAHLTAVTQAALAYAMIGSQNKGLQLLDEAIARDDSPGSRYSAGFLAYRAGILFYAGNLAEVEQTSKQVVALYNHQATSVNWYLHAVWLLGSVAYERNRLDVAAAHFQIIEQMRYQVNTRPCHDSLIGLALIALAQGDTAKAREYADAARKFAVESKDAYSVTFSDSFEIRLAMASHRTPAGVSPQPPPVDGNQLFLETPSLTYAEHLLCKANPADREAGLAYTRDAVAQLRQLHNTRQLIQFMSVHAVALQCAGRTETALRVLRKALEMARPLGFIRTFLDRGARMAELMRFLQKKNAKDDYLRELLSAFASEKSAVDQTGPLPEKPARGLPEGAAVSVAPLSGLSNREMDVLILLEQRLSNKEIADRLFISPETVKRHSANIYRKLNISSRRQAVAAARKLGLLPA